MMLLKVTLLSALLIPNLASAAVWQTTNRWSQSMENEYSRWIQKTVKTDIFTKSTSPYKGLLPDCADAVYSMRIIFAYENGLPFAVLNPVSRRSLITNEISKFDHIPAGPQRVKAFMAWMYDILSTKSVENDTYPVSISRSTVRPGAMILAKESKHSYFFKSLKETGVPVLYYSTQGNDGNLKVRSWPSTKYLFSEGVMEPSGIRDFRSIDDLLKPVWEVSGYSSEQYQYSASRWTPSIQNKLARRQESAEESLTRLMADVCQLVTTRVQLVNKAERFNRSIGDRCLSASEYDDLSTPSRDGQTKEAFNDLGREYQARVIKKREGISTKLATQIANIYASSSRKEKGAQYCPVEFVKGGVISLGEVRRRLFNGYLSSNPNDSIWVRWGEAPGPSEKALRCPSY
ncbi:MAG: hypothetical protein M9962_13925 [Oligoflexia bacterium]|nr:hypothetical protein [Oligoflexia bacterium]